MIFAASRQHTPPTKSIGWDVWDLCFREREFDPVIGQGSQKTTLRVVLWSNRIACGLYFPSPIPVWNSSWTQISDTETSKVTMCPFSMFCQGINCWFTFSVRSSLLGGQTPLGVLWLLKAGHLTDRAQCFVILVLVLSSSGFFRYNQFTDGLVQIFCVHTHWSGDAIAELTRKRRECQMRASRFVPSGKNTKHALTEKLVSKRLAFWHQGANRGALTVNCWLATLSSVAHSWCSFDQRTPTDTVFLRRGTDKAASASFSCLVNIELKHDAFVCGWSNSDFRPRECGPLYLLSHFTLKRTKWVRETCACTQLMQCPVFHIQNQI